GDNATGAAHSGDSDQLDLDPLIPAQAGILSALRFRRLLGPRLRGDERSLIQRDRIMLWIVRFSPAMTPGDWSIDVNSSCATP
ncbi:MAG: hypothetical protein ACXW3G_12395, partial [Rhodoplanes sp.]